MGRNGGYLFKRKGSENWWIRLQYAGQSTEHSPKRVEKSLGTPRREEAEILALPLIHEHKYRLLMVRNQKRGRETIIYRQKYKPNTMVFLDDGTSVAVHDETYTRYGQDGSIVGEEENSEMMVTISPDLPGLPPYAEIDPTYKRESSDTKIIETWIKHKAINAHLAGEARSAWEEFQKIVRGRPLKRCGREDGRKLAQHLLSRGNKHQTVRKKIGHLCAACNLAIREGVLDRNPFSDVVPHVDDSLERLPLSEKDMALIREHLHALSEPDQLLWKLMAATGMRLSEAASIREDHLESGIRYLIVGEKTPSSRRRVPIPTELVPLLPPRIEGPVFADTPETQAKRLRYFLKRLRVSYDPATGTGDRRKVLHSLRHRAKDRLRAAGCPLDIQYEILGHEKITVADGYGHGYPVEILLSWVDGIGW